MSGIHHSITELIGKTPLLRLHRLENEYNLNAEIVAKLELFNPNQNVKERIALFMIEAAEKTGALKKGDTIVEMSSGNTAIGMAAVAAAKGYKFRAIVQDTASKDNLRIIRAFGAEIEPLFSQPIIKKAMEEKLDFIQAIHELLADAAKAQNVYTPNQVENLDNPAAHRATTGPEIWEDTEGKIDIFVSGAGTGGTLVGTGAYLKEKNPDIKIVAYQPGVHSRPVETGDFSMPEILGVHPLEIPPLLRGGKFYDEVIDVEAPDAYQAARAAAKLEGIMVGSSSGAALFASIALAKRPENKGKRIVAILADSGSHYLSTPLWELD
ncbi:MAG: PLP-dependent cysteine synthase family protein [Spirochaetaceae bacterium]|jgi:cysteine synthase A|nr:PLP-dependent cysteine synthase family protein [Spirochaetaceae bacterium]